MDGKEASEPAALLPKIICVTTLAGSTETSGDAATMDSDPRPYSCPVCQKCFASRNYLMMHTRWLHDGLETSAANVNTRVESIVLPSSPSTTLPPGCKVTALLLPRIVPVTTLTDSAETSGDAAIKDSDPGIPDGAITTSAKQSAKAVHFGGKRHACSTCGARFVWRQSLVQHKRTHTGEQPFQCNYCSVTFTCSDRLNNHILTHTEERTHECDVCGKRFKLKKTLIEHHRIHTSELHYTCKLCPATFARSDTLKITF
ncbi:zinc finger protein 157-like isoform X3 [Dermacentor silvarum]|uniref:zinc finger protein 157-like isoform X3 n=1 Tax=Dermacentor silvarum TaxID=543639 RepID=UPI00189793DF|nr:zinc finger protein 157-like isoform X3 [Dermacentor silvarum]XP_049514599.1 zinc finger protein 157-like isoform X3 [Dermacentor silvarum]XP_049514600.1 zinc finger protein 157-like isoform X3 [Dermacentor silvarum]XP_049514601.1 zinc finger protein 157-like isoform X3 [Dermacentor silvarum]